MFEALFQTFDEPETGVALSARLSAFREELARRNLTGFIVPRADQQQNEYVAPSEERLAWLTGFTGSAGLAIVLAREAAVFVDGRYTLQAAKQVDAKAWRVRTMARPAEPVKPDSQARRSSEGGTYSFCCSSARGTTNPVRLRRASSSRNADSRAVSATPASGSSNVWKRASNIMGYFRIRWRTAQSTQTASDSTSSVIELLHLR